MVIGAKNRVGTTIRQKRIAKEIIENATRAVPLTKKELLLKAGLSEATVRGNPARVMEAKGVKLELDRLGFSEDNAKKVVAKIMNDDRIDPSARLKATDQTFKVFGSYAPDRLVSLSLNPTIEKKETVNEALNNFLNETDKNDSTNS